jgi:hypothetical protein
MLIGPNDDELRKMWLILGGLLGGALVVAFAAGWAVRRFLFNRQTRP